MTLNLRSKDSLRIGEVDRAWTDERDGPSTPLSALTWLMQAYWQGLLTGLHGPGSEESEFTPERALDALIAIAKTEPHPGLTLDVANQATGSSITDFPDGSVVVDLRKHIVVPAAGTSWSDDRRAEAYKMLAECRAEDYSFDFLIGFRSHHVPKRAFLSFIHLYGLRPPIFWFEPETPGRSLPPLPQATDEAAGPPQPGRPPVYPQARIDNFLEDLLLNEGLGAFANKAGVYRRLKGHLGHESCPSRSHFCTYLNKWMDSHNPPLRHI